MLKSNFLLRVWDKVISGSCKILVFVALEILLSYKMVLMGLSRPEAVRGFLCNVSSARHFLSCDTPLPVVWRATPDAGSSPSDTAGEHGRHRDQSHRPVAQILWDPRARRVALAPTATDPGPGPGPHDRHRPWPRTQLPWSRSQPWPRPGPQPQLPWSRSQPWSRGPSPGPGPGPGPGRCHKKATKLDLF